MKYDPVTSFRLNAQSLEKLSDLAERLGLSRSDVIREGIDRMFRESQIAAKAAAWREEARS